MMAAGSVSVVDFAVSRLARTEAMLL